MKIGSLFIISKKGGYGNSHLTQDNLHFSTEYVMDPFYLASTEHSISIGGIYQATKYQFYRPQDVHSKVVQVILDASRNNPKKMILSDSTTSKGRVKPPIRISWLMLKI